MLMTTPKLILLRVFNITIGRYYFFAKILRKSLVKILISKKQEKYVACSKYFEWKELRET